MELASDYLNNTPETARVNRFAADVQITLELIECYRLTEIRFVWLFEKLQY